MNAQASPPYGHTLTAADRQKSGAITKAIRHNPTLDIVEMQRVLKKIVSGAVRYQVDVGEVIDIPAREIAQAAVAFTKLENQRRMNLGKANPAPSKSESRRSRSRTMPAVMPAPRREEQSQVAVAPIEPAPVPEPPQTNP